MNIGVRTRNMHNCLTDEQCKMGLKLIVTAFGEDRTHKIIRFLAQPYIYSLNAEIYLLHDKTGVDTSLVTSTLSGAHFKLLFMKVDTEWVNHPRYGYRNSDYWRIKFMRNTFGSSPHIYLYMDDDLFIINKEFFECVRVALNFGVCLPENPRSFQYIDASKGIDSNTDVSFLPYAPSLNSCFICVCKNLTEKLESFLYEYLRSFEHCPERAPNVLLKAAYNSRFVPVMLPEQYAVFGLSLPGVIHKYKTKGIPILCLHMSDVDVVNVWRRTDVFCKEKAELYRIKVLMGDGCKMW